MGAQEQKQCMHVCVWGGGGYPMMSMWTEFRVDVSNRDLANMLDVIKRAVALVFEPGESRHAYSNLSLQSVFYFTQDGCRIHTLCPLTLFSCNESRELIIKTFRDIPPKLKSTA